MNDKTDMNLGMTEHIRKYSTCYGVSYVLLLCVLLWLFQNWPGGFWDWLRQTPNGYESGSTTVRNLGLIVAGLIALPLTLWRIRVADRQAKAAHQQVETSQNQVATSQRSLLNERYHQKGAEMLGSEVLSVRLGGIYALARLAREHPEEYHMPIIRLFCAFVRNPIGEDERNEEDPNEVENKNERGARQGKKTKPELRLDVQEIMTAIGGRSDAQVSVENGENPTFRLDLRKAILINANLGRANLSKAIFTYANLSGAQLTMADLSGAWMPQVNLSGAELVGADLCNAQLIRAKLRGTGLIGAKLFGTNFSKSDLSGAALSARNGLSQEQLDSARADIDNPPKITGNYDSFEFEHYEPEPPEQMIQRLENERNYDIDEPLVWRGKPFTE